MKKTILFLGGLIAVFSMFMVSCEDDDNDKKDEVIQGCNISISSNGNGTVSVEGYKETSVLVTKGTSVTIIAIPDEGYEFKGWCVGGSETPINVGSKSTFDALGDVELAAEFVKKEEQDSVHTVVEMYPEFPGGAEAVAEYLNENIEYPGISLENNSQGRVMVKFIVNTDGSISDPFVVKGSGDIYLDIEAVRVIGAMPNWLPGKHKGEFVRVYYTLPVNFYIY